MTQLLPVVSQQSAASVILAVSASSANTCLPPAVANKGGSNRCTYLVSNLGTKTAYLETGNGLSSGVLAAAVPTASVKAAGTLTSDATNVTAGDTVTIGNKTYTFTAAITGGSNVDGNVKVGADANGSMANLYNAINLGSGAGTNYAAAMTAHTQVIATTNGTTTVTATALVAGVAGNSIATTETSSHLSWGAAVLASGADNTGGTPIAAATQLMVSVPKGHLSIAAICGGSDSTTLYITPA